tara:strand:+ start:3302 stop:3727 length:426 start_codon:yes stop_codon:yes gene_type:complete
MNLIIETSKKDWEKFLKEKNITKNQVDYYLKNILDTPSFDTKAGQVLNIENNQYEKRISTIHGFGIFAKKDIDKGETIGIAIGFINDKKYRSYIGRFTNHSNNKNCVFEQCESGNVFAVCIANIKKDQEILVDYRDHWEKF